MRGRYWSNSRLANWLRGTKKPSSATMEDWAEWEVASKQDHPFRYWLAEDFLDNMQDIVNYIPDKINDLRCYLNNRYLVKSHALTSTLKRGQWYDMDTRILHCLFDEFVNFIEIEKAWMMVCWNNDQKSKYAVPLSRRVWWLRWFSQWRCAEAGLAYLNWEMSLINNDWCDETHPDYGKPTHQALSAMTQLKLYTWWTEIRPNRPDPYEASGWSAYCDQMREKYGNSMWLGTGKTPEEKEHSNKLHNILTEMEKQYDEEDEIMMLELIKIRKSLWT